MATRRAIEGSALSFSSAGSWGGGAPASTDNLIVGEGFFVFNAGLSAAAVNLASLKVHSLARCELGGPGAIGPVLVDVNNSGAGLLWGPADGFLYLTGSTNLLSQESARAPVYLSGGTHAQLVAARGRISVGAAANVTKLYALDGQVEIAATSGSDVIDELYVVDATVVTKRNVALIHIAGRGTVIFDDGATIADGASGGRAYVHDSRAKIIMRANSDVTIDILDGLAGTLDTSEMEGTLTITTARLSPRFNLQRDSLQGRVTVTNETKLGTPGRFVESVGTE